MLAWVGCTADSHELAAQFGDEIALRADAHRDRSRRPADDGLHAAPRRGRAPAAAAGADGGGAGGDRRARRRRGDDGALPGRLGDRAAAGARPRGAAAAAARLRALGRQGDPERDAAARSCRWRSGSSRSPRSPRSTTAAAASTAAVAVARERSGGQFDPRLVEAFADCAAELLDGLAEESSWDAVIAAEPGLDTAARGRRARRRARGGRRLRRPQVALVHRPLARRRAARGRPRAERAGCPTTAVTELRRAALVHDLGRTGRAEHDLGQAGPADRRRARAGAAAPVLHRAHARAARRRWPASGRSRPATTSASTARAITARCRARRCRRPRGCSPPRTPTTR